jgi:hypothetical protein
MQTHILDIFLAVLLLQRLISRSFLPLSTSKKSFYHVAAGRRDEKLEEIN